MPWLLLGCRGHGDSILLCVVGTADESHLCDGRMSKQSHLRGARRPGSMLSLLRQMLRQCKSGSSSAEAC